MSGPGTRPQAQREALLPRIDEQFFFRHLGATFPAIGEKRARVAFFGGCVAQVTFSSLNEATIRVLRANGCEVVIPATQACCGALASHAGVREAARELARASASADAAAPRQSLKIVGRIGEEYHLLDADDVLAFQAERELVWIITAKHRLLATQPLRAIEKRLADTQFHRVHRNAIVNVNHVRKMSALSSQRWLVTLSNSLQLIVSKRLAHSLRQILRW